jgi:hypothetical protein
MAEVASYSRRRTLVKVRSSGGFACRRRSERGFAVQVLVLPSPEEALAGSRQHGLVGIEYDLMRARRRGEVKLCFRSVGEHSPQEDLLA